MDFKTFPQTLVRSKRSAAFRRRVTSKLLAKKNTFSYYIRNSRKEKMLTFTANDAKNKFGEVIDAALQAPVSITKHNRRSVVILSDAEYRNLAQVGQDRLQAEVKAGFDQLDRGELATRTPRQIASDVRRQFLEGKL